MTFTFFLLLLGIVALLVVAVYFAINHNDYYATHQEELELGIGAPVENVAWVDLNTIPQANVVYASPTIWTMDPFASKDHDIALEALANHVEDCWDDIFDSDENTLNEYIQPIFITQYLNNYYISGQKVTKEAYQLALAVSGRFPTYPFIRMNHDE